MSEEKTKAREYADDRISDIRYAYPELDSDEERVGYIETLIMLLRNEMTDLGARPLSERDILGQGIALACAQFVQGHSLTDILSGAGMIDSDMDWSIVADCDVQALVSAQILPDGTKGC